jgi:hypothetical protein
MKLNYRKIESRDNLLESKDKLLESRDNLAKQKSIKILFRKIILDIKFSVIFANIILK